jgi:hypothetical protein
MVDRSSDNLAKRVNLMSTISVIIVCLQEALCMKTLIKVLLAGLVFVSLLSQAHPYGPHWGHYRSGWVAPLVIGGAVGYALAARPQPLIVQQPNVYYQQPQLPYGYHYENMFDANCRCYRLVLVQN